MEPENTANDPGPGVPQSAASSEARRWKVAFDAAPVGMAVLDVDGRCVRVNAHLSEILSRPEAEILGHELAELAVRDGRDSLRTALEDPRRRQILDVDFGDGAGKAVPTRVTLSPVFDDGDHVVELIAHVETSSRGTAAGGLHDPLTGLQNRLLFMDRLTHALARSERILGPVAVLFVNLDHFKSINERYGHAQGDAVLKATATKLQSVVRPSDTVARMGGDEFAVLCEDMKGETDAVVVAERLCTALQDPIPLSPDPIVISASIGIAFAQEGDDPDRLMQNADAAMYRVKEGGRGTYEIYLDAL
jgi:diguanylate cyclase (GGDEF)-like protein/PAS domain S-box-containing protein